MRRHKISILLKSMIVVVIALSLTLLFSFLLPIVYISISEACNKIRRISEQVLNIRLESLKPIETAFDKRLEFPTSQEQEYWFFDDYIPESQGLYIHTTWIDQKITGVAPE